MTVDIHHHLHIYTKITDTAHCLFYIPPSKHSKHLYLYLYLLNTLITSNSNDPHKEPFSLVYPNTLLIQPDHPHPNPHPPTLLSQQQSLPTMNESNHPMTIPPTKALLHNRPTSLNTHLHRLSSDPTCKLYSSKLRCEKCSVLPGVCTCTCKEGGP